jgi:hypothetical protein
MRYLILILFLNIANINLFAQDSLKNTKETKLLLKYSPFSLFGDYVIRSCGVQLGTEVNLSKRVSLQQDIEYIFNLNQENCHFECSDFTGICVKKMNGIRTDTEIKYYLSKSKPNLTGFYVAPHFLYQFTRAIKIYEDDYYIDRYMTGLHLKFGWQFISKKGFVFDIALGIGKRYILSKPSKDPRKIAIWQNEWREFFCYYKMYESGTIIKNSFSISGNFKLGWAF